MIRHYAFVECNSRKRLVLFALTTVRKEVTCPDCLALMGPDPEKLGGFHFPATKFINATHDEITAKIQEELLEMEDEAEGTEAKIDELWDVVHAAETKLRKYLGEGVDIWAGRLRVYNKNDQREYYL